MAIAKSTGELGAVLKETRPKRLPVLGRTNCTNSEAASRASTIFGRPLAPGIDMLPERSKTIITSRVIGGGDAPRSGRMLAVGKYLSKTGLEPHGEPLDSTPTMRPAASNKPEPELPPDTEKLVGTVTALGSLVTTASKPGWGIESFLTAPLG